MNGGDGPSCAVGVWCAFGTRIASSATLRAAVAEYTGRSPERIFLERDSSGRPVVDGGRLQASVSHSHGLILVAIGCGQPIGIDVELVRDGPWRLLPAHALAEVERAELEASPLPRRHETLLRYWVRKEALLKAAGVGLAVDPRTVVVSRSTDSPRVLSLPHALGRPDRWSLQDLEVGGYVAALAIAGPVPRVAMKTLGRRTDAQHLRRTPGGLGDASHR